ncbi:MAG: histone acetyltransferase [Chloroflexi bacterium]|nr:histone acetyltransferase [Chloroflexota bacterium]
MTYKTAPDELELYRESLLAILRQVLDTPELPQKQLERILKSHPKDGSGLFRRDELIRAYRHFTELGDLPAFDKAIVERLRLKPVRTSSGVTPVTVLTKPFPCPGTCIFCPNDIRMPKSYLSDEPGAQRAEANAFDPYLQTYRRLLALYNTGHPTDKIEMIILGGTWSFYPETYQIWFIKRIFDALHDFGNGVDHTVEVENLLLEHSQLHPARNITEINAPGHDQTYNQVVQNIYHDEMMRSREQAASIGVGLAERTLVTEFATWEELEAAHRENENAVCRCVGLVVETRPDHISEEEVLRIRRLGCTKVQIGFQSLNDDVLRLNKRGHEVAATRRAVRLLRQAGFKIHAHWMPNLYGSSPEADIEDYARMFDDPDFRPDELKVYPCSLIESAELMDYYQRGEWRPYTHEELLGVLTACFQLTPDYCRLTRVIRDIPGTDIVVGNKMTNFRELVQQELAQHGSYTGDIRSREIRHRAIAPEALHLDEVWYTSNCSDEVFLQYITPERQIAGFLRLSLPTEPPITPELENAAMIREVHVYGQSIEIGEALAGKSQHVGLGKQLIERAVEIARERGYQQLAVISAIGTREYYRKRGFADGQLYQLRDLGE